MADYYLFTSDAPVPQVVRQYTGDNGQDINQFMGGLFYPTTISDDGDTLVVELTDKIGDALLGLNGYGRALRITVPKNYFVSKAVSDGYPAVVQTDTVTGLEQLGIVQEIPGSGQSSGGGGI